LQTEQAKLGIEQRLEKLDSDLAKAKEESDSRQSEIDALEEEHSELRIQRDELTENRK
jgi:peptidoglycan hydrolase CwlO-like protein